MRGPGAYDGIVVLPNGAVIVSSHHDQALHVAQGGELRPLFVRNPTPAGIGFDRKRNRLLIPSLQGDWLEAWTLPPMEPPARKAARDTTEMTESGAAPALPKRQLALPHSKPALRAGPRLAREAFGVR